MNPIHCVDLQGDRELGEFWERQFCVMAGTYGMVFTPNQLKKQGSASAFQLRDGSWHHWALPDITVWTAPGQHHEVKHKRPTEWGSYGLEAYRLDYLLRFSEITGQDVYYTIHNHALAEGGKFGRKNDIDHWFTCEATLLKERIEREKWGPSWVGGEKKVVPICYWGIRHFRPLKTLWDID